MKRTIRYLLPILFCIMCSCNTNESIGNSKQLSLFAFVISDNNLDEYAKYVEQDLVAGLRKCPIGTELLLYIDRLSEQPTLRHFIVLETGEIGFRIIKEYPEQISTSPNVFNSILKTMLANCIGETYGIIYWSHGDGWLPANVSYTENVQTRSIGLDGIYSMEINDLAKVLSKVKHPSFILFDACFMGCIEVAYALRNQTNYIIASPTEISGIGFPYHLILPSLIDVNESSLKHVLEQYYDFCNNVDTTYYIPSGTATLIDCSYVNELSKSFSNIINMMNSQNINLSSIQAYDLFDTHLFYDIDMYVKSITNDSILYAEFEKHLKKCVLHKINTPTIYTETGNISNYLDIEYYSGLSTYIPTIDSLNPYNHVYRNTEWYKDIYTALSEAYKIVSKEVKIKEAKNVQKIREEASAMICNNLY